MFVPADKQQWLTSLSKYPSSEQVGDKAKARLADISAIETGGIVKRREFWHQIIAHTIQEVSVISENISAQAVPLEAVLFTGSWHVDLGVPFSSDVDLRFITNGEPWETIKTFIRAYKDKWGSMTRRDWNGKFEEPRLSPAALGHADLVLPLDYFDLGWDPENPLPDGDAGLFQVESIVKRQADTGWLTAKLGGFQNTYIKYLALCAMHQLAFSYPLWLSQRGSETVPQYIERAKGLLSIA